MMIYRSLVGHWQRSVGLVTGLLVAVSGFIVLTSTVETSRLELVGTVDENVRPTYDVLVRPPGSASTLEVSDGLVRSGFLADHYGGITLDQVERIRRIPGVEVAAPIAMIGFAEETSASFLSADELVPSDRRSLFRLREHRVVDGGLTTLPERVTYAYFTPYGLSPIPGEDHFIEQPPDGPAEPSCLARRDRPRSLLEPTVHLTCADLADEPYLALDWGMPLLLAAIDPEAEARLVGLDDAVVEGRYLSDRDVKRRRAPDAPSQIPILVSSSPSISATSEVVVEQLPSAAAEALPGQVDSDPPEFVVEQPGTVIRTYTVDQGRRYEELMSNMVGGLQIHRFWQPGPVELRLAGGQLHPHPVPAPDWTALASGVTAVSLAAENGDTPFRRLKRVDNSAAGLETGSGGPFIDGVLATRVGVYDRDQLAVRGELSGLSLAEYFSPSLPGADATTRDLLGGRKLQPNAALTGYLQPAPALLTPISSLSVLFDEFDFDESYRVAPVSAVRVRVSGIAGYSALDRERVRVVAETIEQETGLQVDVVMGSSTAEYETVLPGGRFGRPELTLAEPMSVKGVATVIREAIERKSLLLFSLILVVCALFVGNASAASVRAKRTEFGVLASVGWGRRPLFLMVLGELAALGLVAGIVGVGVAWLTGLPLGIEVSWSRALLAVPASLLVALVSGLLPAWRAASADPMDAILPAVVAARRSMRRPSQLRLGVAGVWRVPVRTLLGAAVFAVATGAVTLLGSIATVFHGQVSGTLLGDAVTVQVRTADVVAAFAMVVLSVVTVADILYLNVRDRMAELAVLSATGWTDAAIGRLIAVEAAVIGLIGSVCGVSTAAVATLALVGGQSLIGVLAVSVLLIATGPMLASIAAVVPIRLLRGRAIAPLLAGE